MGDRTWARTSFNRVYLPLVKATIGSEISSREFGRSDWWENGLVDIEDDQANWGNMDWLTDLLVDLMIPFDLTWANGGEYGSGTRHTRFNEEGGEETLELYDDGNGMIEIGHLMTEIKEKRLKTAGDVVEYLQDRIDEATVYKKQWNLVDIPVREFNQEEAEIIMKFKVEEANENN